MKCVQLWESLYLLLCCLLFPPLSTDFMEKKQQLSTLIQTQLEIKLY